MTFDTFVQRIASALGLRRSGAESEPQVKSNLESSPVLLVLDNAETFEEAVKQDEAKRISDFVNNARKVRWTRFKVPPLEKLPARQYFREIYNGEIDDDKVDSLLGAVDFHPLSIHILAYTAEESEWTGKRLLDEWNAQQDYL
ncbi:hypothetical protein JVU11DRAFT_3294 [Chiua virens]|nr:hypothetical protein JVU11DRAFT_3294 [Chiua virens]